MKSNQVPLTPGLRILCRDAEWLVKRVEEADRSLKHFAVHCVGVDDLVRGHEKAYSSPSWITWSRWIPETPAWCLINPTGTACPGFLWKPS